MSKEVQRRWTEESTCEKSCFSCKHRKCKSIQDYCDIDEQKIGFFELYNTICDQYEREEGD